MSGDIELAIQVSPIEIAVQTVGAQGAPGNLGTVTIDFDLYGAGLPLGPTTPTVADAVRVPPGYSGVITGWELVTDVADSFEVDVEASTFGTYPTFASITGTETPAVVADDKASGTPGAGWGTTAITAGSYLRAAPGAAAAATWAKLTLTILST
jgi:hypothetical protein